MTTFRSGFVTVVGRPNVGKSTLVNPILGTKVTITSPRPNTTRTQVRGVLNRPDAQVVFVDTPGIHKPRTALGERLNESATSSLDDVDVVVAVVDATGRGRARATGWCWRPRRTGSGPWRGRSPLAGNWDRANPDRWATRPSWWW